MPPEFGNKAPVKAPAKKGTSDDRKKAKKKLTKAETYKIYIYKVLSVDSFSLA